MRRRRRSQSEAESSASKVTLANEATKPSMFRHFKVDKVPSFHQAKSMCCGLAGESFLQSRSIHLSRAFRREVRQ